MKIALGTRLQVKTKSEQCIEAGMQAKIKMMGQSNGHRKEWYESGIYHEESL